jgi:peptide chain release factor 2
MYMMWGEKYGYKIKELIFKRRSSRYKTVTSSLKGLFFGYLKGEMEYID